MKKAPKAPTHVAALKRQHADRLREEMRQGVVRRAATFTNRKKDQERRACRQKVDY